MLRFYEFKQVKMIAGNMVHCFLDERHYIEMSFNGHFGTVVHDARYNEVVASISQCIPCYNNIGCRVGVMMDSTLKMPSNHTAEFLVVRSEFGRNNKLWHYIEDGNYIIEHNINKDEFEGCYDVRTGEYFEHDNFEPLFDRWGALIAITATPVYYVEKEEPAYSLTDEERAWLIDANNRLEMFEKMNEEFSDEEESLLMCIAQFCVNRGISPEQYDKICSTDECF